MKDVHFMGGQAVQCAFDEILGEEMPGAVQHQAAPGQARPVHDLDGGQDGRPGRSAGPAEGLGRQELEDGLDAVKITAPARGLQVDAGRRDRQLVALRAEIGPDASLEDDDGIGFDRRGRRDGQVEAEGGLPPFGQVGG